MCYWHYIHELLLALFRKHEPDEWCVFNDSSKASLKAVLLHNGNMKPSIPTGYSVHLRETYDNMDILLQDIQYEAYQRYICADLKVIEVLMGMQGTFTKHYCFLCLWDSCDTEEHYQKCDWGLRPGYEPGRSNIKEKKCQEKQEFEKLYLVNVTS